MNDISSVDKCARTRTHTHTQTRSFRRSFSLIHSLTAEYADNISLHLSMYLDMCVSDMYDHFCGSFNILKISFIAVVIVAITVTATVQR